MGGNTDSDSSDDEWEDAHDDLMPDSDEKLKAEAEKEAEKDDQLMKLHWSSVGDFAALNVEKTEPPEDQQPQKGQDVFYSKDGVCIRPDPSDKARTIAGVFQVSLQDSGDESVMLSWIPDDVDGNVPPPTVAVPGDGGLNEHALEQATAVMELETSITSKDGRADDVQPPPPPPDVDMSGQTAEAVAVGIALAVNPPVSPSTATASLQPLPFDAGEPAAPVATVVPEGGRDPSPFSGTPGMYAIRVPVTEVHAIRRHLPTMGLHRIMIVTQSGVAFPPFYFHNGGVRHLFTTLRQFVTLTRVESDPSLFLVNDDSDPLQHSLHRLHIGGPQGPVEPDALHRFDASFNDSSDTVAQIGATVKETAWSILDRFSRVTQLARDTTSLVSDVGTQFVQDTTATLWDTGARVATGAKDTTVHLANGARDTSVHLVNGARDTTVKAATHVAKQTAEQTTRLAKNVTECVSDSISTTASVVSSTAATVAAKTKMTHAPESVQPAGTQEPEITQAMRAVAASAEQARQTTHPGDEEFDDDIEVVHNEAIGVALDGQSATTTTTTSATSVVPVPTVDKGKKTKPDAPDDFEMVDGPDDKGIRAAWIQLTADLPEGSLTPLMWSQLVDDEGRVVDAERVRLTVFRSGCDPKLRAVVWPFLIGAYMWNSTEADRQAMHDQVSAEFQTLSAQWRSITPDQATHFFKFRERTSRIEKDAIRTDRQHPFFEGESNTNVTRLQGILMCYSFYNFDLGYVQGMSDLLAPLLIITDNDVSAYWCFKVWMSVIGANFHRDQNGMHKQLVALARLLHLADPKLHAHFEKKQSLNMFFCFRWLLIRFKREFTLDDTMRLWEASWACPLTRHLHLFVALGMLIDQGSSIIEENMDFDDILKV